MTRRGLVFALVTAVVHIVVFVLDCGLLVDRTAVYEKPRPPRPDHVPAIRSVIRVGSDNLFIRLVCRRRLRLDGRLSIRGPASWCSSARILLPQCLVLTGGRPGDALSHVPAASVIAGHRQSAPPLVARIAFALARVATDSTAAPVAGSVGTVTSAVSDVLLLCTSGVVCRSACRAAERCKELLDGCRGPGSQRVIARRGQVTAVMGPHPWVTPSKTSAPRSCPGGSVEHTRRAGRGRLVADRPRCLRRPDPAVGDGLSARHQRSISEPTRYASRLSWPVCRPPPIECAIASPSRARGCASGIERLPDGRR
jgi:hypothetical protein